MPIDDYDGILAIPACAKDPFLSTQCLEDSLGDILSTGADVHKIAPILKTAVTVQGALQSFAEGYTNSRQVEMNAMSVADLATEYQAKFAGDFGDHAHGVLTGYTAAPHGYATVADLENDLAATEEIASSKASNGLHTQDEIDTANTRLKGFKDYVELKEHLTQMDSRTAIAAAIPAANDKQTRVMRGTDMKDLWI